MSHQQNLLRPSQVRHVIDGDSYRLDEAKERQLQRSSPRRIKKPKP